MGLQEKRLAKNIQDNVLPGFLEAVKTITGFEPKLDINWDSFIAYDEYPLSRLEGDIFPSLLEVFQSICRDEMGREALKSALKSIRLENTDDEEGVELRFADGELYHRMQLAGGTYRRHGADQIISLLEKSL
ncbi:MAG: hypothetical protein NW218_22035 [Saprospiraceae bacterium]|nr:hypothetical protein [Saprospiraceae bacterium]